MVNRDRRFDSCPKALGLVLAAVILTGPPAARTHGAETASPDPTTATLLAVAESEPWTTALGVPVASKLRQGHQLPLLVAISNPPTREANWLIGRAAPKRAIVLSPFDQPQLGDPLERLSPEIIPLGRKPAEASIRTAKRFWKQTKRAIVTQADDPEAIILGSALAARLMVPLLLQDGAESQWALSKALGDLGADEILLASSNRRRPPQWTDGGKLKVHAIGVRALQDRLITALGPDNIRNIVLARAPEPRTGAGPTAWLAPYLSLVRGAPVVLCHASSPTVAEGDVLQLIARHGLHPRTVTVLADYPSIGDNLVEIDPGPEDPPPGEKPATKPGDPPSPKKIYQVKTEPCVPTTAGALAAFGVGRIPFESLEDASVLFARGLLRERLFAKRPGRLLLIANAGPERRPLPLCETISRVTAEEFKNFRVPLDEFYGKRVDTPEVQAAARKANLIIYEGHLAYQDLIDVPSLRRRTAPDTFFEEELDNLEEGEPSPPENVEPQVPGKVPLLRPRTRTNRLTGHLEELPIIVLQSCESLDERVLWRVDELGGVAVIGSMTPIHSGSGSTLINAAAGALLYRDGTLGESLRDAQNYLLCLGELKVKRGQKEQAKSRRVALSFRLWGDPELHVFPPSLGQPEQPPVAARWTPPGKLTIQVPARRFAEVESALYSAHVFPGSQPAGMVKQRPGEKLRRVTPVYFFRLPLPVGFPDVPVLERGEGEPNRALLRVDAVGRWLYVVYFPETEKAGETVVLRLAGRPAAKRTGRAEP